MILLGYLLLAALAGLLLNLTPCVLPVMPLKIAAILREAGGERRQRTIAALALLAGSLSVFLGLGIATATLRLSWGALFQSQSFLTLLVLLLGAAGISSLLGLELRLPQALYRLHGRRYLEPYFAGALAGVLSTPCTGPFLGGVLVYALTQPPLIIVALFGAIGAGLALPYVVLLLHPGWLERLPRQREWSRRITQMLGLLLLAGAVFFAQTLLVPAAHQLLWVAWFSAVMFWAVYYGINGTGPLARLTPGVFLVLATTVAFAVRPSPAASHSLTWRPYSAGLVHQATAEGRPVLIEFTADWCLNCKVLERTVYADPEVSAAAHKTQLWALQADLSQPDPVLERTLVGFGGAGLPFAVVLDRSGEISARLPDLFTAERLRTAIAQAGSS